MLQGGGLLLGNPDPVRLHPYRCHAEMGKLENSPWAIGPMSTIGKLARAMGYLVCHLTLAPPAGPTHCLGSVRRICRNVLRRSQSYG